MSEGLLDGPRVVSLMSDLVTRRVPEQPQREGGERDCLFCSESATPFRRQGAPLLTLGAAGRPRNLMTIAPADSTGGKVVFSHSCPR